MASKEPKLSPGHRRSNEKIVDKMRRTIRHDAHRAQKRDAKKQRRGGK